MPVRISPPAVGKTLASGATRAAATVVQAVSHAAVAAAKVVPALPNIGFPLPDLPPGVSRLIPSRTLTSLVPRQVRDVARYAAQIRQAAAQPRIHAVHAPPAPPALPVPPPVRPTDVRFATSPTNMVLDPKTGNFALVGLRGYLEDPGGDIMHFQYNPAEVEIDPTPVWIVTELPGQSHPFIQYGSGGQRRINFTLEFSFTDQENRSVIDNVNWLHSFMAPSAIDSGSGATQGPHVLNLGLGAMTTQGLRTAIPVILLRAPAKMSRLFRPGNLLPLYGEVRLEVLALLPPNTMNAGIQLGADLRTTFGQTDRA